MSREGEGWIKDIKGEGEQLRLGEYVKKREIGNRKCRIGV